MDADIRSVLIDVAHTRTIRKRDVGRLMSFEIKCCGRILNVRCGNITAGMDTRRFIARDRDETFVSRRDRDVTAGLYVVAVVTRSSATAKSIEHATETTTKVFNEGQKKAEKRHIEQNIIKKKLNLFGIYAECQTLLRYFYFLP